MPITPSDIEHKTFSTALRGYDLDEVDDFLDEIVVALRDLQDDLATARARVAELEHGAPQAPAPVAAVAAVPDEAAVGRILILAQEAADRVTDDAKVEAEKTLEEARAEAEKALSEARAEADTYQAERDQRKAEAENEMAELSGLVAAVRTRLAFLATTVADKLDEMDSAIAAGPESESEPELGVDVPVELSDGEAEEAAVELGEGEVESEPDIAAKLEAADETDEPNSEDSVDTGTEVPDPEALDAETDVSEAQESFDTDAGDADVEDEEPGEGNRAEEE